MGKKRRGVKPKKRAAPDWSKRKAPPKSSPLRAAYEASPTAKKRRRAARKAQETRLSLLAAQELKKQRAREKRAATIKRRQRMADMYKELSPLLGDFAGQARKSPNYYDEPRTNKKFWKPFDRKYAAWAEAKERWRYSYPEDLSEVLALLEAEHETDDLGWNIEESGD